MAKNNNVEDIKLTVTPGKPVDEDTPQPAPKKKGINVGDKVKVINYFGFVGRRHGSYDVTAVDDETAELSFGGEKICRMELWCLKKIKK